MKKYALAVTGCLLLAAGSFSPARGGAAEAPAGAVRLAGKVVVTKRDAGVPSAATFTTPAGKVYALVMDEKGQSLGAVMHGQSAEIYGLASEEGGQNRLRVLGYVDERVNAGHELWRHMRCNACVVLPATRNAAVPADLHGTVPVAGRHYDYKRKFTAWTRDDKFLWAAADNALLQFDLAGGKLVRSYGRAEGLPDQLVYQLASDGKTLWIAYRGGVGALPLDAGKVADLGLKSKYACVRAADKGVWIIADTGTTFIGSAGLAVKPVTHPALPTAGRMSKAVENGIWTPHWERRTAHFIANPVAIEGRLYAGSWGDIYELADGKWAKIADGGFDQTARGGKLYFLSSKGLNEYDPKTGKTETLEPPEEARGRYTQLLVTDAATWLAADPVAAGNAPPAGGGLSRFDLAARQWQTWAEINGRPAKPVACLSLAADGAVWAVTMEGQYLTKSAHPGMTTTRRQDFQPTGFSLQRHDPKAGKWESWPLALAELDQRLICGQDGCHGTDGIVPQFVESLSVGAARIFAVTRLVPRQYFGGYWPCLDQVASRADPGAAWAAKFEHHPEQLDLQGEQPLILNISNGELTRIGSSLKDQLWEAIGHDLVLGLFFQDGKHWAVTEECVACFDEAAGSWKELAGPEYRWYWRATAALEDGKHLYLGSDRGLVCRLDTETGRFEPMTALKDRSITVIGKGPAGEILVGSRPAPLGALPMQLAGKLQPLAAEAARFDGKSWTALKADDLPAIAPPSEWLFKFFDRKDHLDKSMGNFLCGPLAGDPEAKPRYYLKEAFYPQFLGTSADGGRMWISTYTGLVRLDLGKVEAK